MTTFPATGRIAGIDYGTVRIGIAICDPGRRIASPLDVYTRRSRAQDADYFRNLVQETGVVGFVVGLPVHTSGRESQKSIEAQAFAAWLGEVTGLPCCLFDERYSTQYASTLMQEAAFTKKKRKQRVDKVAAQVILASYLESSAGDQRRPAADAYRPLDDRPDARRQ